MQTITTIKVVNISVMPSFLLSLCDLSLPPPRLPQAITDLFSLTVDEFAFSKLMEPYRVYSFFLFSFDLAFFFFLLNTTILIHPHIYSPFLFIVEQYSIIGIYHNWLPHMPIDEHLGCFQFSAIANKAAMNSHLCTSQYIGIGVLLCWVDTEECSVWLIWYV